MKKKGIFNKASIKRGVIEGGMDALVKKVKQTEKDEGDVKIGVSIPSDLHRKYKLLLVERNISITDNLISLITKYVNKEIDV